MQMSNIGRNMLVELEGFKTKVYHDQAGLPTIGVGHLLTRDELNSGQIHLLKQNRYLSWRDGLSRTDVDALLEQDLPDYEAVVARLVTVTLEQHQFDALVSFCFNVGEPRFTKSTLLKMVNTGRFEGVASEFQKWIFITVKGVKKESRGLINRRKKEISCWNGDLHAVAAYVEPSPAPVQSAPDPATSVMLSGQRISPRQYVPNRWLALVNPLDWFPRWGTYLSILAALILFVIDVSGYPVSEYVYAILAAFATARIRRAIDRQPFSPPTYQESYDREYEYASYR